jgi:hypothetical protein
VTDVEPLVLELRPASEVDAAKWAVFREQVAAAIAEVAEKGGLTVEQVKR